MMLETLFKDLVAINDLYARLGQRLRLTEDEYGNKESVTTHTLILVIACIEIAPYEDMDRYLHSIIRYALVHDICEFLHGDIPTLHIPDADKQRIKDENEQQAYDIIEHVLGNEHWISQYIIAYNRQETVEAAFVKYVDKILPKLTHVCNNGSVLKREGMDYDKLKTRLGHQYNMLCSSDFDFLNKFFQFTTDKTLELLK
jgi:5'-deoxynucleotidase YfbR-like HD superfamily hydrolase